MSHYWIRLKNLKHSLSFRVCLWDFEIPARDLPLLICFYSMFFNSGFICLFVCSFVILILRRRFSFLRDSSVDHLSNVCLLYVAFSNVFLTYICRFRFLSLPSLDISHSSVCRSVCLLTVEQCNSLTALMSTITWNGPSCLKTPVKQKTSYSTRVYGVHSKQYLKKSRNKEI